MASFAEQVEIHLTHGRQVSIRVVLHHRGAVLLGDAQAVVGNRIPPVDFHGGNHGDIDAVEFRFGLGLAVGGDDDDFLGVRAKYADGGGVAVFTATEVGAENLVRVVETTLAHGAELGMIHCNDGIFIEMIVTHT